MSTSEHVSRVRRLYKLILRLHRSLPPELRIMGDNYARDEFKRHKECKAMEAQIFMQQWTEYAETLKKQFSPVQLAMMREIGLKQPVLGMPFNPTLLDHMTEDQMLQLYELHKAAYAKDDGSPEFDPAPSPADSPTDSPTDDSDIQPLNIEYTNKDEHNRDPSPK